MTTQGGAIEEREFIDIIGDGRSSVSLTIGMNFPYGDAKVSVSVRLTCNQDEATIDKAGSMALTKAMTLCKDGMEYALNERNDLLGRIVAKTTG